MMKNLLTYLFLLLAVPFWGVAQINTKNEIVLKGRVISVTDGLPLVGASIQLKGSTQGTFSDAEGRFSLKLPEGPATLLISYIGFQPKELSLKLTQNLEILVKLNENATLLKEVVVSTGYQNLPQERATGSFSKIDNETLNRVVATDILSKLDNTASGLTINRSAFGEPSISIRGQSTIMGNAEPLIVIDNFPYDGDINNINPNDVLSITVLKDAAAASIWGVRAGNGVIVITTKKGKAEEPLKVELSSNVTIGQKPDLFYLPAISSTGFIDFERQLFNKGYYQSQELASSHPPISPAMEVMIQERDGLISAAEAQQQLNAFKNLDVRNDMNKYFFRNSVKQQYALNLRGGSNMVRYYFSGGYDTNLDNAVSNQYKRLTLNSSTVFNPVKKLELAADLNFNQSTTNIKNPGISLLSASSSYSDKKLYPYARLADENGNPLPVIKNYNAGFVSNAPANGYLSWEYSPLAELQQAQKNTDQYDVRANTGVKYSFTDFLNTEVKYQYERSFTNADNLQSVNSYYTRDLINQYSEGTSAAMVRHIPLGDILDETNSELNSQTLRGQLNFFKDWNRKHTVSALAGVEVKQLNTTSGVSRLYGYDSQTLTSQGVDYTSAFQLTPSSYYMFIPSFRGQGEKTDRFRSYYANASYTFNDRYTLSGSGRIDQSNFFGVSTNQRSVPLWSTGLSWAINKEGFYHLNWLPYLKLRTTYGYNGNIDKTVTAYTTARYTYDWIKYMRSLEIINPPNPELKWEKIGIANIGFDFETKNKELGGSIEYYQKKGEDLIGITTPDPTSGVLSYRGNLADIKGQGIDVNLNSRILDKGFKWYSTALFSYATDQVTKYTKQDLSYNYTPLSTGLEIVPLGGRPVYSVYSYRFAGLDGQTGDPLGYVNGEKSSDYAAILNAKPEELVYNGSARPTYWGALRNSFTWKGASLSFNISYKLGYYFRRNSISYTQLAATWSGHSDYDLRWKQSGDERSTNVPSMPETMNASRDDFYIKSEALVENGSHIRFQDVNLSYTLDKKNSKWLPLQQLQFYIYGNNLGIIWRANKQGIDPDAVPNGGASFLPTPRTFAFGFKADF